MGRIDETEHNLKRDIQLNPHISTCIFPSCPQKVLIYLMFTGKNRLFSFLNKFIFSEEKMFLSVEEYWYCLLFT